MFGADDSVFVRALLPRFALFRKHFEFHHIRKFCSTSQTSSSQKYPQSSLKFCTKSQEDTTAKERKKTRLSLIYIYVYEFREHNRRENRKIGVCLFGSIPQKKQCMKFDQKGIHIYNTDPEKSGAGHAEPKEEDEAKERSKKDWVDASKGRVAISRCRVVF